MCQLPVMSVDKGCSPVPLPEVDMPGVRLGIHAVKQIVSNGLYNRFEGWMDGSRYPEEGCTAITMVGQRRLNNLQWLLEDAIANGVPGGFIETGVWRGGACIVAASIFKMYGQRGRKVFVADSFKGIPPVDTVNFPKDAVHEGSDKAPVLVQNSFEAVEENFRRMSLLEDPDYPIEFLVGYFKDTLKKSEQEGKFKDGFAVIRLDGDIYQSTWEALEVLWPLLHPGGYAVIDDIWDWRGCYDAVMDFRAKYDIFTPIVPVYHDFSEEDPEKTERKRGGWFRKPYSS
jgi:O-methyltransferase